MCGIFGFSGRPGKPVDDTKIRMLALLNEDRGGHSTGIFTVGLDKNRTQMLCKDALAANFFILRDEFQLALHGAGTVVGHTRAATWGKVSKENAHPFQFEIDGFKAVGVHNGYVSQEIAKLKYYGEGKAFPEVHEVDSMLIFALLSKTKGDYKVLSELEGAITTAFMFPDKYPTTTFLYARTARNLHIGRSKEGIYYSSEERALRLTGITDVEEVPDYNLLVIDEGEVQDIVDLPRPKLHLPVGAQRTAWKGGKTDEELRQLFPGIDLPVETTYNNYHSKNYCSNYDASKYRHTPPATSSTPKPSKKSSSFSGLDLDDAMGMIIKDLQKEIPYYTAGSTPSYADTVAYDPQDGDSCLILFKLLKSNDQEPCVGFVLWDESEPNYNAVTMVNGIGAIKYPLSKTYIKRTIKIADPVRARCHWSITVQPQAGRVMEVTLQMPFPENASKPNSGRVAETFSDASLQKLLVIGRAGFDLYDLDANKFGAAPAKPNEDNKGGNSSLLPTQGGKVSGGHEGQETQTSRGEGKSPTGKQVHIFEGESLGGVQERGTPSESFILRLISTFMVHLSNLPRESRYSLDSVESKLYLTEEFRHAKRLVNNICKEWVLVDLLLNAAVKLRTFHAVHGGKGNVYSVLWYAKQLLVYSKQTFLLPDVKFTADDYRKMHNRLSTILNVTFNQQESQDEKKYSITVD